MVSCPHCNIQIVNKYALNRHIKTSKKCLSKQSDIILESSPSFLTCEYCNNSEFTRQDALDRHYSKCCNYLQKLLDQTEERIEIKISEAYSWKLIQLEEENEKLKLEIEQLKNRPTTINVNNQIINNNLYLNTISLKRMQEEARNLSVSHIDAGAVGYAKYAVDYPFKDSISCNDFSRRKLLYRKTEGDYEGDMVTDYGGRKLTTAFFKSIREETARKAGQLYFSYIETDMDSETLQKQQNRLQKLVTDVNSASRGEKTDFTRGWVSELCSLVKF